MSAGYEPPILYARDRSGNYRFIDDVANGDACGCYCPACDQPMRARNAGMKRRHSFAHQPGMTCTWAVEAVIAMLAKQAIEESGRIALPALYFHNAVEDEEERISKSRVMRVTQVESVDIAGRQAPCLAVTIQGGSDVARFGLCVTLRRKLTPEQEDMLLESTRGIVLVDLGIDLARQRSELGKHYDRDELIKGYQNKDFLAGVLVKESSDLMSWGRNVTREEREAQSIVDKAEVDRRKEEERERAEREREEGRRREAEIRQREAEEREPARKEYEEACRRKAEERAARESREGIVREPECYVTEFDEYDIRLWGDKSLPRGSLSQGERLVYNGALLALMIRSQAGTSVRILTDLDIDAIDEIPWNLEDLSRGFDEFVAVFGSSRLQKSQEARVLDAADGRARMRFLSRAREYCCALQGLIHRGVTVLVNTADRRSWGIEGVDVDDGSVLLHARR